MSGPQTPLPPAIASKLARLIAEAQARRKAVAV